MLASPHLKTHLCYSLLALALREEERDTRQRQPRRQRFGDGGIINKFQAFPIANAIGMVNIVGDDEGNAIKHIYFLGHEHLSIFCYPEEILQNP